MRCPRGRTQASVAWSVGGTCVLLFLSSLVSVLCWLSKNNLDAFLPTPLPNPVFWNILSRNTIISVLKLLKNSLVKPSGPDTFVGALYF